MNLEQIHNELRKNPAFTQAEKNMRFRIDLANAVLYARLAKGWSQTELARRVHTQQANISRIESYQANPTLDLIRRLCDSLGIAMAFSGPTLQKEQGVAPANVSKEYVEVEGGFQERLWGVYDNSPDKSVETGVSK